MLEQVVENKHRIDLLNERLEINERKVRDLHTTIKSLEEKFEVQQQMVQYVQNKAESTDSKFSRYRLDVNILETCGTNFFIVPVPNVPSRNIFKLSRPVCPVPNFFKIVPIPNVPSRNFSNCPVKSRLSR